ncbi:MAG: Gfo/Idh/MocA family protein [Cyclobacteriaceae bacterium]
MLKAAIIGCGKVAHLHAQAIQTLDHVHLQAVCGRNLSKTEDFARQYGASAHQEIGTMISKEKIDFVILCTPHPVHLGGALEVAEAGAHLLIEKPLASTLSDCDTIIKAARSKKLKLGVISQRRFYEPVLRVKSAIDEGKIGKPALGTILMLGWRDEAYYKSDPWRGSWKHEGGGVMVNQAPHQFDLLHWLMGPVQELFGYWDNLNHPYIEVEDTAVAVLRFQNGALGNILVSNAQKPGIFGKVHVHGSNGASVGVQTDGGAMFIAGMAPVSEPPLNDLWTVPGEESLLEKWREEDRKRFGLIDPMSHYMARQIEDFAAAIIEDKDPLVSGEDGRKTVEIFTAVYRSQRDRKPIKFPLTADDGNDDFDGRLQP